MMMHVDMVYAYPIGGVGLLLVGIAVLGAVLVELGARRLLPFEIRRLHNDAAAAMFGVIGTTFAVLLAFVAMLSFEGYDRAKAATATEAAAVLETARMASGFPDPLRQALSQNIGDYLQAIGAIEWPAQARGHLSAAGAAALTELHARAMAFRPATSGDADIQAGLLAALAKLAEARAQRQAAVDSTVPEIVWVVLLLGGVLTVVAGSFLGVSSLRLHLVMSGTLAASGALVVVLIVALSNPFRGDFRVSTAPFDRIDEELAIRAAPGSYPGP